jgi:hypothetical protein
MPNLILAPQISHLRRKITHRRVRDREVVYKRDRLPNTIGLNPICIVRFLKTT